MPKNIRLVKKTEHIFKLYFYEKELQNNLWAIELPQE